MEMPDINLGQYPKRTFEDLRLQTIDSLQECSPAYFYVYPSHPGIVIRQLHSLLSGFIRFAAHSNSLRCLVWGRAGDIVHVYQVLSQFKQSVSFNLHGVVLTQDDENWAQSQIVNVWENVRDVYYDASVWCEERKECYVQPPVPQNYFNCVLIFGEHRQECLSFSYDYLHKSSPYLLLAVEDENNPYCSEFSGRFFAGGPVWRAA